MSLDVSPNMMEVAEQVYSGTIAWTGTSAPSGSTTHKYQWCQYENLVYLRISLKYSVSGSALSKVTLALPTDLPTPAMPSGLSSGSATTAIIYSTGAFNNGTNQTPTIPTKSYVEVNSGATGYDVAIISNGTNNTQQAIVGVLYFTK